MKRRGLSFALIAGSFFIAACQPKPTQTATEQRVASASTAAVISKPAFTAEFVKAFAQDAPSLKVKVVQDMELELTWPNGGQSTAFLDNAYDRYKQSPDDMEGTVHRYVQALQETPPDEPKEIDTSRIVPIVKDRAWMQDVRQTLLQQGAKLPFSFVYDDLNTDLVILYATDSEKSISYLTPEECAQAKLDQGQLRKLACANLQRLLPSAQRIGEHGLYIVTSGAGDYDASLLLLDYIWDAKNMPVNGDFVVAIPTRDMLIVTGSQDQSGLTKMKNMVQDASANGSYRLTSKLFTIRQGKIEAFDQ